MRINTLVKYDKNMNEIYSEGFEHKGEVALCGGKTPTVEVPEAPDAVVKQQTKSVTESAASAKQAQAEKAKNNKGIKSTLLSNQTSTNTTGSLDTSDSSNTQKKTLLG